MSARHMSVPQLLDWAKRHPAARRIRRSAISSGATFLKQALTSWRPTPAVLQRPATDANFTAVTAPLWAWYDALRPAVCRRHGEQFPENGPRSGSC